ncbi:MAG: PD40 domain-containing protein, partial [Phycisphaerae bacterium]|nr:PD40 domain-containing protein [Phycisphaerae bacterium]
MPEKQKTPIPRKPRRLVRKFMLALLTLAVLGPVLAATAVAYLQPKTWKAYTGRNAFPVRQNDGSTAMMAWEEPTRLPAPINGHVDEVISASMSADAKTLVLARRPKGGKADLFVSQFKRGAWSDPQPIITVNSDEFDEFEPAITLDGRHLLYSSDRPDGMGGYDIWVAPLTADGWGVPMNLGPRINSEFNERSPAMNVDKDKLYLSSDRPTFQAGETERRQFWQKLEQGEAAGNYEIFACDDIDLSKDANPLRDRKLREMIIAKLGGSKETEAAVKRALTWYAAGQEPDGRWDSAKHGGMAGQDIAATGFAALCFYGWGERHDKPGEYQDTLARAVEWLANESVKRKGNFAAGVSQGMYGQGIAAIALAEAYGITGDKRLEEPLKLAVQVILKAQQPDQGGWRYNPVPSDADTSVLGWQVMALHSARKAGISVPQTSFDLAAKWLDSAGTGEHGGLYGYQSKSAPSAPMTAEAMFARQLLGAKPSDPRQQESAAFLVSQAGVGKKGRKTNLPGPKSGSNFYHWYYGALAMYQHQGADWQTWNEALRPLLLARQTTEGDQAGSWPGGQWKRAGPLVSTAMATLALEVYYRYLPMYQMDEQGADAFRKSDDVIPGLELKPRPMRKTARQLLKIPLLARHIRALSSTGDEFGLTFSPGGDYVYFASNRLGGTGGYDLYRSRVVHYTPRDAAEAITTHVIQIPENAADPLNTLDDENSASLAGNGRTMIFSSNRSPDRAGSMNLYVTSLTPISPIQAALAFLNSIKWWLIGLLSGLIALIALILWWRNAENRNQASLLVKCLIGSAGLHAGILVLLSLWMIGEAMIVAKGDPMEIAIDADALASEKLSEAIREQVTEIETSPEPIHVVSDRAPTPMPTIDPVEIAPRVMAPTAVLIVPSEVQVEVAEVAVAEPKALPRPDVRQVQPIDFAADVDLELKPQETPQPNQAEQPEPEAAFALAPVEPKLSKPVDDAMKKLMTKIPLAPPNIVDVLIETDMPAP